MPRSSRVGPPADYDDVAAWPTTQDVDDLIDGVKVTAPKGSEYGKTEIFYLKVKNTDRARAIALAAALCNQIESQYGRLRNDKTNSAMLELSEGAHLAAADVQASVKKLTKMEEAVGGDLSELRHLHQSASAGDSDLRRKTVEMESELRQAKTVLAGRNHLLEALNDALIDKDRLLGLPNGMLESLPALRKMKDGLIDAQVRTASLSGTMSSAHPSVRASLVAEREIALAVERRVGRRHPRCRNRPQAVGAEGRFSRQPDRRNPWPPRKVGRHACRIQCRDRAG